MKKELILAVAVCLCFSSVVFAGDDDDYKYESSTGNRYKYDLSNPSDKIRYDIDPSAQIHDSIYKPINPKVDIDQSLGQYGGGIQH